MNRTHGVIRQGMVLVVLLAAVDLLVRARAGVLVLDDPYSNTATPLTARTLYDEKPPPDILFMGSSRTQVDLAPSVVRTQTQAVFGRAAQTLNLGIAAATPQTNYWLLKNVIQPAKQPALLIYGAAEYEFNPNAPSLPPNLFADELATLADYPQAFPDVTQHLDAQLGFLLGRPWYLFRVHTAIRDTLDDYLTAATQNTPPLPATLYGFWPLNHVITSIDVRQSKANYVGPRGFLHAYTVQGYQAARFEQLLQLAQARHIRVVILNLPVTRVHDSWLAPADYRAYVAYLQQAAARYGARFVDYNDHTLWREPDDFADTNHLNRTGAKKLSQLVSKDVVIPALRQLGWPGAR